MAPATTFACPSSSAAMRCTEPMKAPPPPTMPARKRRRDGSGVGDWRIALMLAHFPPFAPGSDVRVREGSLAAIHIIVESLIHPRIERRRLVLGELLFPQAVGALDHVPGALRLPLLDTVVIGERRAVEGGLEIGLGVCTAEEVLARPDLTDGIERLPVVGKIDA